MRRDAQVEMTAQQEEAERARLAAEGEARKLQDEALLIASNIKRMESEYDERKQNLEAQIDTLTDQLELVKRTTGIQSDEIRAENARLEDERGQLVAVCELLNSTKGKHEDSVAHLESHIKLLESRVSEIGTEITNLEQSKKVSEKDIAALISEQSRLADGITKLKEQERLINDDITKLESKRAAHDEFLATYATKKSAAASEYEELVQKVDELRQEEVDAKTRVAGLRNTEAQLNKSARDKESEIAEKSALLAALEKQVDDKIAKLKKQEEKEAVDTLAAEKGI